jgi:N-acetyl sugar amidotransferase
MDESDVEIRFDAQGVCSHCQVAEGMLSAVRFSPEESERRLSQMATAIKAVGKGRAYDVVLGLSGGVDSSYTAYIAHKMGLRPLAVHFDNGWNTEIAVSNIKNVVKTLGFDLETYVIDWPEFRDIQRAFIKASVVDIEMVTDHAIVAATVRIARRHDIRYILSGQNRATEHCMPKSWIWNKQDLANLKDIHSKHGERPLKTFPTMSTWKYLVYRRLFFDIVQPLNNLNYRKTDAMALLAREVGWRDYGGKHYESLFTKFYQAYILPEKFGIDKRKAHLSALVRNGEIDRDAAVRDLAKPLYQASDFANDKAYVLKKLGFSEGEFDVIMATPPRSHTQFKSDRAFVAKLMSVYAKIKDLGLMKQVR